ncbi:hypothetical protein J7E95_23270 [Streptomyces sp. ISL-14]|nr:hypothetical protein [Streptomyces sp. ISL-14]
MKYLVFQMDLEVGNPEENRKIIERWLEANYCDDLDVVVLPEMWSTGYALVELKEICKVYGNQSIEFLQSLGKRFNVNLVGGSIAVLDGITPRGFVSLCIRVPNTICNEIRIIYFSVLYLKAT